MKITETIATGLAALTLGACVAPRYQSTPIEQMQPLEIVDDTALPEGWKEGVKETADGYIATKCIKADARWAADVHLQLETATMLGAAVTAANVSKEVGSNFEDQRYSMKVQLRGLRQIDSYHGKVGVSQTHLNEGVRQHCARYFLPKAGNVERK